MGVGGLRVRRRGGGRGIGVQGVEVRRGGGMMGGSARIGGIWWGVQGLGELGVQSELTT